MDDFEGFVEKVKSANKIEDVIDESGPEYKLARRRGNYLRGQEHDSLVVRVDEQYYFWNDTSEKGDVFNWLMTRRNFDFWEALKFLAERAKIDVPESLGPKEASQGKRLAARLREDVWGIAQRVMAKWLWEDPEVLAYVRGRGWSDETIRAAGLGFSGRNTAAFVQEMSAEFAMHGVEADGRAAAAVLGFRGDVKRWGQAHQVEVQDNWKEWGLVPGLMGRTRLVYPHWEGGRVKYLSARNILGAENYQERVVKSWNLPAALAGERRVFFNHVYGRGAEECVVLEGPADAVSLGQWGLAAVAICGTNWKDHEGLLKELRGRHGVVYLGLDMDDAGVKALVGRDADWPLGSLLGPMARVVQWGAA